MFYKEVTEENQRPTREKENEPAIINMQSHKDDFVFLFVCCII